MNIIPKKNPHDLTADEIAFLKGTSVPPEVKGYLSRQHENIGTKTAAYRKVAASAQAEVEALLAVRDLAAIHGEMANLAEAKERIKVLERRQKALESSVQAKDGEIMRRTAENALAVHADD